jgi:hypothetical protein
LEINMSKPTPVRSVRLLPVGGAKARTNDNTGGPNFEDALNRYQAG